MNNLIQTRNVKIIIIVWITIAILALIIYTIFEKKQAKKDKIEREINKVKYAKQKLNGKYRKKRFITEAEKYFYIKLLKATKEYNVVILPQINLASIIDKNYEIKYRLELFRNIDFGIFDKDYNILALIEYNDPTHLREDRVDRDIKVKIICEAVNIPLITFWTKDENTTEYIDLKLKTYIENNKEKKQLK